MLRKHIPGYSGAFLAMVLAAALMGGSLSLALGTARLDGIDVGVLSAEDQVRFQQAGDLMSSIGGLTAVVAAVVSVILIASTISFVVAGRRRELALLRLSGARPGQVTRLVVGEVALLSVVAGVIGLLFAVLIGRGYLALFGSTYPLPRGLTIGLHWEAMLGGLAMTVLAAVLAALGPARKIGKVQPIEALSEGSARRKPMSLLRWISGFVALAGVLGFMLVPGDAPIALFVWIALLQGLLALVALVQLAPVVVAPISRFVCGLVARIAPGPGTLAQGHSSWNAARTASLASPALLLLAVPGVFLITFNGLSDAGTSVLLRSLQADAVIEQHEGPARADAAAVATLPGIDRAAPTFITTEDFWEIDDDPMTSHQLLATDVPAVLSLVDAEVTGDPAAVRGNQIAVMGESTIQLGDVLTLRGPENRVVEAKVVATIRGLPVNRELIVDLATFDLQGAQAGHRSWFLGLADGTTVESVAPRIQQALAPEDPASVDVLTISGWVEALDRANSQQMVTSLMILLGGASLLSLLAIGVSILTALRERGGEFALSRRAGAQPGAIQASTLIETVTVMLIAGVLGVGVIGAVWARLLMNFIALDVGTLPSVPIEVIGWFALAGLVMALMATIGGTQWALRAIRVR